MNPKPRLNFSAVFAFLLASVIAGVVVGTAGLLGARWLQLVYFWLFR